MSVRSVVRSPVDSPVRSVFAGSQFNPILLFGTGAQGAWYDPSDFSTLFQNAAGTTPVTAVEQPVRLMLDRSRGLVLGGELAPAVGSLSGTISNFGGSSGTFSAGVWSATTGTDTGFPRLSLTIPGIVVGRTYLVQLTLTISGTFVNIRARLSDGGSNNDIGTLTSSGSLTARRVAGVTNLLEILPTATAGSSFSVTITNISVRELPGNHALAPNDASRPILRARYNLFTRSEDWSVAPWANVVQGAASAPTLTPNAGTAPDGTTTATRIQFALNGGTTTGDNVRRRQVITTPAGNNTFSFYVRSFDGVSTYTMLYENANGFVNSLTVTGEWQRVVDVATYAVAGTGLGLGIRGGQTPTNSDSADILVWGAQLLTAADQTSTGGAYQRIAAATDYDVSNPVWRPYLAFDGSDDSLSTSAIDFSGTDEMTVFAGLTKLSDAATALLAELSANLTLNNGSFYLAAPGSNGGTNVAFVSKGTIFADAVGTGLAAPITNVLTGVGDIGGDVVTLRVNGAQAATKTTNQGTGNFGNHPLFIGARNNTNFPFNGRLYSLAVLGRTATAPEISAMETYVAGKTGVNLA